MKIIYTIVFGFFKFVEKIDKNTTYSRLNEKSISVLLLLRFPTTIERKYNITVNVFALKLQQTPNYLRAEHHEVCQRSPNLS